MKTSSTGRNNEDQQESSECTICMESLGGSDGTTKLTCNHRFHTHCIDHWQTGSMGDVNRQCPLCRKSMSFIQIDKSSESVAAQPSLSSQIRRMERIGRIGRIDSHNWWIKGYVAAVVVIIILLTVFVFISVATVHQRDK